MRLRIFVTLLVCLIGGTMLSASIAAQDIDLGDPSEGTPVADVPVPVFGIVAVGDYPEGYFDDVVVAPGESVELTVAIVNVGEIPVDLRSYQVNALNGPNGGFSAGEETDAPVGANAWVDYPTIDLSLAPDEQRDVTFTVSVPADAAPGQYISGLIVQTADSLDIPGSTVLDQILRYAISIGILVPGEITYGFTLDPAVTEARQIDVPISNTGNYLVRPAGVLTLTDADGAVVHTEDIQMGSVYAGLSTTVSLTMPEQFPAGDYTLDLSLSDEASGLSDGIDAQVITLSEPVEPSGVIVEAATVQPNADPIAFAAVALTITNGGPSISAADIALEVERDGEPVETYPLATNQVLPSGPTEITERYIPATDWAPGTWTFRVVVSAVDPESETATTLGTFELGDEITVP